MTLLHNQLKTKTILFISLCGIFFSTKLFAIDVTNIPPLDNYVVDYTQTLTPSQIESLSSGAYLIQQQTSAQIAALIIPNRDGHELYDIALNVFRDTKLGDKTLNNGLLLIIAKDEKKLRLTVGYGLEGNIPDVVARDIVEKIRPHVDKGDLYTALQMYYTLITPYIEHNNQANNETSSGYNLTFWDQIRGIVFFLAMSSAGKSHYLATIVSKYKNKLPGSNSIFTRTTGILLIVGIISFTLFSFGFFGALLGYIFGLIRGNRQTNLPGIGGILGGGFRGNGFSSGGGGFSGGFGGSSGGGGAGD